MSLFAYDNDTFVVHSFLPHMATVEVVTDGRDASVVDLATGTPVPGLTRGETTSFTVFLEPHTHRAFQRKPGAQSTTSR